jgi:PAS domain S-box-containing protein
LNRDLSADLEPGVAYAELLRAELERRGTPATTLSDALERHRNLPWRLEERRSDGAWVQILEQRVAGGDTLGGGTLRIMRDITAIKQRELQFAELAQRNAVLASTVASVTSGVVICDATQADQPIVFANAAFTRISGYTAAEVIGRNCRFLQGRDTDRETVERMRRAITVGRAVTVTLRNYRKDGRTFWNEVNISPLHDEQGKLIHFVGILQDVTNRIRTEENLREAKDQAEVANRSKSEFLANVSHELRTPLNAILGFTEIMQMEMFGPLGAQQYHTYTKDVHYSGRMLLDIINDILDLSKIEAGRMELFPEAVEGRDAFEACLRMVTGRAQSNGVTLHSELPPDLPKIRADPRALKQMLTNLLTNAIKFTPKGGRVLLSARLDDDQVELSVADTGIGIAQKDIAKVLEPFGQADNPHSRSQQGTGLGLPIVKALVEQSGGSFRLESRVDAGTTVTLRLPAVKSEA